MFADQNWTPEERKAKYLLQGLQFPFADCASISLFFEEKVATEILSNPFHRVNFLLNEDKRLKQGHRFICLVRDDSRIKAPTIRREFKYTEAQGAQMMKFIYDEYSLGQKRLGRRPEQQDKKTLGLIKEAVALEYGDGRLPFILTTDKATFLPVLDTSAEAKSANKQFKPYFKGREKDYVAMMNVFHDDAMEMTEKYPLMKKATQFVAMGLQDKQRNFYELYAIEPFCRVAVDQFENYQDVCLVLRALQAGYIDNTYPMRQHWTQHVEHWQRRRQAVPLFEQRQPQQSGQIIPQDILAARQHFLMN